MSEMTDNNLQEKVPVEKFIVSQAIKIALRDIPDGLTKDNIIISEEFRFDGSRNSRLQKLLDVKSKEKAFHPQAAQIMLPGPKTLVAFLRIPQGVSFKEDEASIAKGAGIVLCIYNISGKILKCFPEWKYFDNCGFSEFKDIITDKNSYAFIVSDGSAMVTLEPWEFAWIKI